MLVLPGDLPLVSPRDIERLVAVLPGKEDRRELYFKRPKLEEAEAAGDAKPGRGKPTSKFADDLRSAFREGLKGD